MIEQMSAHIFELLDVFKQRHGRQVMT